MARSFLTPERRLVWRPDTEVAVYPKPSLLKVREVEAQPAATAPKTTNTVRPATTITTTTTKVPTMSEIVLADRVTTQASLGRATRKAGLLLTPEETFPSYELKRLHQNLFFRAPNGIDDFSSSVIARRE